MRRTTHTLPPGFKFPERTQDKYWSAVEQCDGSGRISVPLYKKVRGQDAWIKRTPTEIDVALSSKTLRHGRAGKSALEFHQ
jgi:hypothetical protein